MKNKADFKFGMISVSIESDKSDTIEVTNLAYNTLLQLIPEAKKVVADEKASMLENMKLLKGKAECDNCEDCSDDFDECGHPAKKMDEIKNLYV